MDLNQVRQIAEGHYQLHDHPALIIDLDTVKQNYLDFRSFFPQVEVHFALKSLTDAEVIKTLALEGCSFEVASLNELQALGKILHPHDLQQVFYSNPAKSRKSIMVALIAGVRWFSVDSIEEVRKLCQMAEMMQIQTSSLKIYLRLTANSKNSYWPLSRKFGLSRINSLVFLTELQALDCKLAGFTFHVGSQCMDHEAWGNAVLDVDFLIEQATELDVIQYEVMVNLGGGFPCDVTVHGATLEKIADHLASCLERCAHWERMRLAAEPGRYISSSCGTLATRVILRTEKHGDQWLYLDCGVFHGMMEPSQGVIGQAYTSHESTDLTRFIIAGPSCDSADILPVTLELPRQVREEDLIFIKNSGAYSMAYATGNAEQRYPGFNGFFPPSVYYIHK